jgi:flagellar assembly factor FliW
LILKINTRHFGETEIDEKYIIHFPEGIPGFETVKNYVLLDETDEENPFLWLQGLENTNLALAIIDPKYLMPEYYLDVDDSEVEVLDIKDVSDVRVYCIVVVPEDITKISANFKAPVVINLENRKGKQVIARNEEYEIKHYIFKGLRKAEVDV